METIWRDVKLSCASCRVEAAISYRTYGPDPKHCPQEITCCPLCHTTDPENLQIKEEDV